MFVVNVMLVVKVISVVMAISVVKAMFMVNEIKAIEVGRGMLCIPLPFLYICLLSRSFAKEV
jgi:hypothetical protein